MGSIFGLAPSQRLGLRHDGRLSNTAASPTASGGQAATKGWIGLDPRPAGLTSTGSRVLDPFPALSQNLPRGVPSPVASPSSNSTELAGPIRPCMGRGGPLLF